MSGNIRTIDGVTPAQLGMRIAQSSQRPGLPGTRDKVLDIPGRNGALDFGADMQPRFFSLDCTILAAGALEMQILIEQLARLLVDQHGKPRTVSLVYEDHPDRAYDVRYSGSLPIERMGGFGRFALPMVAYDPYSHATTAQVYQDTITASPYVFEVTGSGDIGSPVIIALTNEGPETINEFTISIEYRVEGN